MRNELVSINGVKFSLYQARLHDEMYADPQYGNPLLWWGRDLETRDFIVCGVKTKREAMQHLQEAAKGGDE